MIEILHRKKAKVESEFFLLIVEREGKVIFSTLSNKSFEKTISIVPCDRFDILDFNPAIDTRFSPRDCEREREFSVFHGFNKWQVPLTRIEQ